MEKYDTSTELLPSDGETRFSSLEDFTTTLIDCEFYQEQLEGKVFQASTKKTYLNIECPHSGNTVAEANIDVKPILPSSEIVALLAVGTR